MSNEFNGPPLVAGSARGVRAFDVDSLGRLLGVTYKHVWKPGENEATCQGSKVKYVTRDGQPVTHWVSPDEHRGPWQTSYRLVPGDEDGNPVDYDTVPDEEAIANHRLETCSCGFYAYYDNGTNGYAGNGKVEGVVEAWGETALGTRGFRASKAKLLALTYGKDDWPVYKWAASKRMIAACVAILLSLVGITASVIAGNPYLIAFNGALLVLNSVLLWLASRYRRSAIDPALDPLAAIRRNYPGVPVFRSRKAMLRAFPPDRGELPTPETDPDFWTRSI